MSLRMRAVVCALVGATAGFVFYRVRGLFPEHAFLLGIAIAALTYSALRAIDNLRGAAGESPPGNEEHPGDQ